MIDLPATTKSILVVDDSADYLSFVQLFLEGEGFQVATALSTESMKRLLRAETPDLVISDVRIPGDEAFASLDYLMSDARMRTIPILLCTAAVQEVERSAGRLREQGVEVLYKPFDVDELLEHVRRLTRAAETPLV